MKNSKIQWLTLFQGIVAVLFGVLLILWPIQSLVAVVWLLAAFLLLESILLLFASFFYREGFAYLFLHGLVYIVFSLMILGNPSIALNLLVFLFAIASIVAGIIQIVYRLSLPSEGEETQIGIFSGVATLAGGILLLVFPELSLTVLQIIFGLMLLLTGFSNVLLSMKRTEK